jgi:NTE family protein
MMKMRSRILVMFALCLAYCLPSGAQVGFQSYDPVGDSVVVAKMRAKMDRIRRRRPTVAVVLSGGGAKGAAHVGVLRYLEEQGIPIDMVLGTSMGGLVGGLYSIGYSPDFLDSLLRSVDWSLLLSDKVPQEMIAYRQRKYKEKYFASVPFFYSVRDLFNRTPEEDERMRKNGLHFGAGDETGEKTMMDNLFGSLPSGYIFGHNVNNIFSGLTVGYQDDVDFTTLPIPYFCIAAEMVSGKALLWHEGKLNTALRSTMSIPGIFAPVRTGDKILVDGGLRNNYPTDVAREMGADIIIGVELSDKNMTYQDINNLADIIWQAVDILGRDSFETNVDIPDITIKPDLHEYNMMSFDTQSVANIIGRGYAAAQSKADEIRAIKRRLGPDVTEFQSPPAVDLGQIPIVLSAISFEGITRNEANYLLEKLNIKPWDKVYKKDIEDAIASILATGSFDFVRYELLGESDVFTLNIICQKGPAHHAGIGMRFDTETVVSAIVNLGLNVHRIRGSAWDFTAKIASNPYLDVHYTLRSLHFPTLNAVFHGGYYNATILTPQKILDNNSDINFRYTMSSQKLYASDLNWKRADVKMGIKNELFGVSSLLSGEGIFDENERASLSNDYLSFFAEGRTDTFDNSYFPTKGHSIGASYDYVLGGLKSETGSAHIIQFDATKVMRTGGALDIIPSIYTRLAIGENIPLPYMNLAGGSLAGRYMEQQVPFVGINHPIPLDNKMIKADLKFRVHLTDNNWLSLNGSIIKHSDFFNSDLLWTGPIIGGASLEYAYNTIMGPLKFNVHYSNLTNKIGAYFSFGYDF